MVTFSKNFVSATSSILSRVTAKTASCWSRPLSSTQKAYPRKILSILPTEIIIRILVLLSLEDLINCRQVSKHLLSIIEDTPAIQYLIELQIAGYVDCPSSPLNIIERLQALRRYQDGWRKLRVSRSHPISRDSLGQMVFKRYLGNVFLGISRTQDLEDFRLWNVVRCLCIERSRNLPSGLSRDDDEFVVSDWKVEFEDEFEACAADPSQHLLVLLKNRHADATHEWWYELRVASLLDGTLRDFDGTTTIQVSAPFRHFFETPGLQIQDDLVGIASGRLHRSERNDSRVLEVVLVNHITGLVQARLVREYRNGLEFAAYSFTFVSQECFLLAVSQPECFAIEVYAIEPYANIKSGTPSTIVHIATYNFPQLQRGCTSTGSIMPLVKSYCLSLSRKRPPAPFSLSPAASLLFLNRYYFSNNVHSMARLAHIVPLSLFLSTYAHYKREERNFNAPEIIPWKAWGPTHSRMFVDDFAIPTAAHGSKVILNGNTLLDFNMLDARKREIHDLSSATRVSAAGSMQRIRRYMNRVANKVAQGKTDEVESLRSATRVIRRPTIIPRRDIFVEDVVTNLPYRETRIDWPDSLDLPTQLYGGDVWIASRSGEADERFMHLALAL